MDPGSCDRRITLLRGKRPGERKFDALGQPEEPMQPFGETWANVRPASGMENLSLAAGGIVAKQTLVFTFRWRPDVNPLDAILFDGKTYEVESVLEVERRTWLEARGWARAEQDVVPGSG